MPTYPLPADWAGRFIASASALAIGKCEDRPNRGQIPDFCQRANGGDLGEFWCMDFQCTAGVRALGHAWPLLRSGSCEQQRQRAKAKGALRTRAEFEAARARDSLAVLGWVGLCIGPDDAGHPHAHHTFAVGNISDSGAFLTRGPRGGFLTIEGNAADPKKPSSRDGDGAYDGRERGHPADATVYEFIDVAALAAAVQAPQLPSPVPSTP